MAGPWEKYGGQQSQGPWAKYGGSAPPPDAGMTPPPMPAAPIPQELQGPPAPQYGQDVMHAAQRGTLRQQMLSDAQPYVQSAQIVGGAGAGPGNLAATVRGAGKVAGFAEKFLPWSRLSRAGEAIEGATGSLADRIAASAPTLSQIPLSRQTELAGQRATTFGPKPSVGSIPPRETYPARGPIQGPEYQQPGIGPQRGTPRPYSPPPSAAPRETYPARGPMEGPQYQQPGVGPQRADVSKLGPKPSVGSVPPRETYPERAPRERLIKQMGGRPVEEITDAAVKEKMETSPEVTYGKYAKAHQGKGSRTYPEPDYFQEQGANRAPWGGNFPHQ